MRYDVTTIDRNGNIENYIATDYITVAPTGRLGHKVEERIICEVKILPEGKKRNKCYSSIFGDKVSIKELETGRRLFTL